MTKIAFTAPHHQAAEVGARYLREGASAVDAMVAAAAMITVVYPHMNSIGGDGFWLIQAPGQQPLAIDACGWAATAVDAQALRQQGLTALPTRGGAACLTLAGTIDGWRLARDIAADRLQQKTLPLSALLAPAIDRARQGVTVTESLASASAKLLGETAQMRATTQAQLAEFRQQFTQAGAALVTGTQIKNPALANTFEHLAAQGLDDFYRGDLAQSTAAHLERLGSPLRRQDLAAYRAQQVSPLRCALSCGHLYNLPLPTQGIASMLILAIFDHLYQPGSSAAMQAHWLIEATKEAFKIRDRIVADPSCAPRPPEDYLQASAIRALAAGVGEQAQPWPQVAMPGDTVWMGAIDRQGVMVSFIQSIYWEFGAGVINPETGIIWNNRGSSFRLDPAHPNALVPKMKPFHTLNPALAELHDGRRLVYGTMGGEGQPQTQAIMFARRFYQGKGFEAAIAQGRWLLGRTWGEVNTDLKMEADLYAHLGAQLEARGHRIQVVSANNELMGHAGALMQTATGELEVACDPRSDGRAFLG